MPGGLLALAAGPRVLRDPAVERAGRPDVLGAAGLVIGVGALAFAPVRAPDTGWGSVEVVGGLVLAAAGLAWVLHRSRRHPAPALDLAVLRVPAVGLAALAMVAFTTGFAGMLVVNVLFLTGSWGWSARAAGLGLMAGLLVVVVVSRLAGHLSARVRLGPVAMVGSSLPAGLYAHLHARDTELVHVSRAPYERLRAERAAKGWDIAWYSSHGSAFNYDFHVTLDPAVAPLVYNYRSFEVPDGEVVEGPGISCFLRVRDRIFHTYSHFARGAETVGGSYYYLDLTAQGCQEDWEEPKGRSKHGAIPDFS